jgi:membrane protein implicated in regulation of membrane protease activity
MITWFNSLNGLEQAFAAAAAVGSIVFLFQLVMMLIGGDHGADAHAPGMEISHDVAHADSDIAFQILSVQSVTAFVMVFGFAGFAMSRGSGFGALPSLGVALVAGSAAMWLVAKTFAAFRKLQSSGTLDLRNAVGQTGRIYLGVKPHEPGKIEVAVQGRLQIFDAVSETGEPLPTDTRVVVVRIESQNMMVVKRVDGAAQKGNE